MAAKKRVELEMKAADKPDTDPTELAHTDPPVAMRSPLDDEGHVVNQLILTTPLTGGRFMLARDVFFESQIATGTVRKIVIRGALAFVDISQGDGTNVEMIVKDWSCGV